MRRINYILMFSLALSILACGGGSGGDDGNSDGFFAGVWNFRGALFINDCNANVGSTFVADLTVNQDGERVVVNSGSATLTGTTTEEDGFQVTEERVINGCPAAAGYEFRNASDGEADAAFAIITQCGGTRCTAGWGGTARLLTARDALEGDGNIELVLEKMTRGATKASGASNKSLNEVLDDLMNQQ